MTVQTPEAPVTALTFQHEQPADAEAIEALYAHAFGPGRFTKVSERVRETASPSPDLSFCAWSADGRLLGAVRQWRVKVGDRPVVFLGPLAVMSEDRRARIGALLVERACEAARAAGEQVVLLVGDEPYFQRFGFSSVNTAGIRLPGPVDPKRVLTRALAPGGDEGLNGLVTG